MNTERYLTITGVRNYHGLTPFTVGGLVRCRKEPDNDYDGEAIQCTLPLLGTVGYVANSPHTVIKGTCSAGRLYDQVDTKFYVRVMFISSAGVICRVETGEPSDLRKELMASLMEDDWDKEEV